MIDPYRSGRDGRRERHSLEFRFGRAIKKTLARGAASYYVISPPRDARKCAGILFLRAHRKIEPPLADVLISARVIDFLAGGARID